MPGTAFTRLAVEYEKWNVSHPFGFIAEPQKLPNGSLNFLRWECHIPGLKGTPWEGGVYKLCMSFNDNYPSSPPRCRFYSPIFHPNVYECGAICSTILDETQDWHPTFSIKYVLLFIQRLLSEPRVNQSVVQPFTLNLYLNNRDKYEHLIKMQAHWYCRN